MNPFLRHTFHIINHYQHQQPLHHFLKKYFKQHPVLGSRDRKIISSLVYNWYRASKWIEPQSPIEQLADCALISGIDLNMYFKVFGQEMPSALPHLAAPVDKVFPDLSLGISAIQWQKSWLLQPDVYLRIRPNFFDKVYSQLKDIEGVIFWDNEIVQVPPATKVEHILDTNSYVIQDAHSQKVMHAFPSECNSVWDCCCGAGGKSLWLADHYKLKNHVATDIRASILKNLKERFHLYQLRTPFTSVLNLENRAQLREWWGNHHFDIILADVPCSGSGTWGRTPEDAYFFNKKDLNQYTDRQRKILEHLLVHMPTGMKLFYITCSVFKEENENQVNYLIENNCTLLQQQLLDGTELKCDSMFYALLVKN